MNLTFVLLHLRGALLNCSYDKLEVQSLMKSNNRYTYCGYHSNFNFFPDMNVFTVIVTLQLMKPFDLDAIFSAIDKQLIFNPLYSPSNEKKSISLFQLVFYKVANKYYLTSFHVSIVNIYRIQIAIAKSKAKNYVIYDGPGYRFNILNRNGDKFYFVASTFQCLIQFLFTYQWNLKTLFFYDIAYNDDKVEKTFHTDSGIIQFSFINCLSNFCVLLLVQPDGFYFNITVLNMNVTSPETSYCLFQGLNIGEIWKYSYSSIDELCSDFKTPSKASSYYTRGSSLYMVLYWYKGYTFIKSTVLVHATKCQAVYLNICKYHHYCKEETVANFEEYMYNITYQTRLRFGDCFNYQNRLDFHLPPRECVVLVLFDRYDVLQTLSSYELLNTCKFTLSSKWGKSKIHYIDGFLEDGNYVEGVGHKDCFSSKHPMCNTMLFDKSVHEFHHLKFINKFKHYLRDEIDIALVKINYRQTKNLVNIMLIGLNGTKEKKQYGLTAHQPVLEISYLMFRVALSTSRSSGLDWILSIDKNITIGSEHKSGVCSFNVQRSLGVIFIHLKHAFLVFTGK